MMKYNEWNAIGDDLQARSYSKDFATRADAGVEIAARPDMAETTADVMARAIVRPRPKPASRVAFWTGFALAIVAGVALIGVALADGFDRHAAAMAGNHIEGF